LRKDLSSQTDLKANDTANQNLTVYNTLLGVWP